MIALVTVPRLVAPAAGDPPTVASAAAAAEAPGGIIPPKLDDNGQPVRDENGQVVLNYDRATPQMLMYYFPHGLLGLGLTALLASFMSGMAGNVTALNTVWTYDIYQSYIHRRGSDRHYLWMGRFATVVGIALAILSAYVAKEFNNIMDLLQLVFAFVNAPLFATFALGMFWRRTTGHGAFFGLLSGTLAAALHHGTSLPVGSAVGFKGGYLCKLVGATPASYPSEMAQNFWTAIYAFGTCLAVSVVISLLSKPRPAEDLKGLVYSLTPKPDEGPMPWYKRPAPLAIAVLALTVALNFIFR
jgi:SSS family solute:Na+ symporter